jgi:hypothetical protein
MPDAIKWERKAVRRARKRIKSPIKDGMAVIALAYRCYALEAEKPLFLMVTDTEQKSIES